MGKLVCQKHWSTYSSSKSLRFFLVLRFFALFHDILRNKRTCLKDVILELLWKKKENNSQKNHFVFIYLETIRKKTISCSFRKKTISCSFIWKQFAKKPFRVHFFFLKIFFCQKISVYQSRWPPPPPASPFGAFTQKKEGGHLKIFFSFIIPHFNFSSRNAWNQGKRPFIQKKWVKTSFPFGSSKVPRRSNLSFSFISKCPSFKKKLFFYICTVLLTCLLKPCALFT